MAKKEPQSKKSTSPAKTPAVNKAAGSIFDQIRAKTGVNDKKIDDWQEKWLAMPKTRTKYAHLKDVPEVVGEEFFAMANDIVEFVQGKEGGQSAVFKKIKENFKSFTSNPVEYMKQKASAGQKKFMEAKDFVQKKAESTKMMFEKTKGKVDEAKKMTGQKVQQAKETAGKAAVAAKPKKPATQKKTKK